MDGVPTIFEIIDTGGPDEYILPRNQGLCEAEAFILVYSVTNRSSFSKTTKFYREVESDLESRPYPWGLGVTQCPVILVGNKQDGDRDREVSEQEGKELAQSFDCEFLETSAKNGTNLGKLLFEVGKRARRIRQRRVAAAVRAGFSRDSSTLKAQSYKQLPKRKHKVFGQRGRGIPGPFI